MASPPPTSLGVTGTWVNLSSTIILSSAVNQLIDDCETAWTAGSVDVTSTLNATNFKAGSNAVSLAIAAAFTTGIVAYRTLPATLDLSTYEQITFWIRANANIPGSTFQIHLCSDNFGAVPVNTFNVPAITGANLYCALTLNNGAPLNATINSIALVAIADPGTITVLLDNFNAVKAKSSSDSLSLNSFIGKNTGSEEFLPIQSINGTTIRLDNGVNTTPAQARGYYGVSETVTAYKRECFPKATINTSTFEQIQDNGTEALPITFSGGWNRVDMSTQVDESWYVAFNGGGVGLNFPGGRMFVNVEKLVFNRADTGFTISGNNIIITDCRAFANSNNGFNVAGGNNFLVNPHSHHNTTNGISMGFGQITISNVSCFSNRAAGVLNNNQNQYVFGTLNECRNNGTFGIVCNFGNIQVRNLITSNNVTGAVQTASVFNLFKNCILNEAIEVQVQSNFQNWSINSHDNDDVTGNHIYTSDGGVIRSDTGADRRIPQGFAWKFSPTSTNRSSMYPLEMILARIACRANKLVTVQQYAKRDNAGITARLILKGGQIDGVPNDVLASVTSVGSYDLLSFTFTPTEDGVVELTGQAWGGTTFNAWFHDSNYRQAL
ncbi:MAG: right-handed parallel beta-helix repeat-containing protein [Candidatus Doudnabacteria bacterium]|nr:right-handed parallel beta-helix repeat-containing protein [Candidatus Doudnabacteria bacterium]